MYFSYGDRLTGSRVAHLHISASFLAELSVSSPRKLIIFIIYKNIFWIKVFNTYFI